MAMCNYWHGGTIECRGDGFMWDADCDGYDPDDKSFPCPACNTGEYLREAKEFGESVSFSSGMGGSMSGVAAWHGAVRIALEANPCLAPKLLRRIGVVRPLEDDPADPAGFIEQRFDYRNTRYLASRNRREGAFRVRRQGAGAGVHRGVAHV
jgi:hypothetical protein